MKRDFAFEMSMSNIRFGSGATREVGMDLADLGVKRVMVLSDPNLVESAPVESALESLSRENVDFSLFDAVRVEPTDASFQQAIDFATEGGFDAFVAVGGGSTMDTAKAANLYSTYPADFLEYVNHPIGRGRPVPGPLKPLIAIPTTAGTGSETTGVAIFDLHGMKAKTGIARPETETHAGHHRSREHEDVAARRSRVYGSRRPEPCSRVLYGHPLRPAAPSRTAGGAARLSGLQSGQRHLGPAEPRDRVPVPGPGRGGS